MSRQNSKLNSSQSLVIKSAQVPFTSLVVKELNPNHWAKQLAELYQSNPELFKHAAFCLDSSQFKLTDIQLEQLIDLMREQNLNVFAWRSVQTELQDVAHRLGLSLLTPVAVKSEQAGKRQASSPSSEVLTNLRSGQQHYARNSSLVILGNVNDGAEVMADGDIHIHGQLRGRAMAGVQGNSQAKIICHGLTQAELIAINGIYMLNEQFQELQGPQLIQLENEQLVFKTF